MEQTGTTSTLLYPNAPGSFVDLVRDAKEGVVAIRSSTPVKSGPASMFPGAPETAGDVALGTGFLIDHGGTFVITNDHIAAAAPELRVVLAGGQEVPARVVGRDARLDVALLSVEIPRAKTLALGDSDELKVGEWLVVLGNPFGDEVTASAGIVSATGRDAAGSLVPGRAMGFRTFLQTDARITRGNSGGPVINTAGQVIGVSVATGDRLGEIGFVVPIDRVKEVLDALRDYGAIARSWLGILVRPVTQEIATANGLDKPKGALVTQVLAGSPALKAGVAVGDIVLRWAGKDVDARSLPWAVANTPVGKAVEVIVWRTNAEHKVVVTTEKMPE
ncbi:MAG TPA: trypsin-like peptidase domain-containing protein [Kofleriaceae bacterium]|nr:trypsin-like peptidase domain-containing protein [Kofleriaceae bacterium]